MRRSLLIAAGAAALLVAVLSRGTGPGAATSERAASPRHTAPQPPLSSPTPMEPHQPPSRDIFRYVEPETLPITPVATPLVAPSVAPTRPDPPPVRLVGLLRVTGGMKAALSIFGEVFILGLEEEAGGYKLISIDEDEGVRLRDRAGAELRLPLPGS